ncbi:hypothetical protein ACJX0J_034034, partial [Zea mays]
TRMGGAFGVVVAAFILSIDLIKAVLVVVGIESLLLYKRANAEAFSFYPSL